VQCIDVTEQLLVDKLGSDPELDRHVASCAHCAHLLHGLNRLDAVLMSSLVVAPPLELQHQLAQLPVDYARPQTTSWWARATSAIGQLNLANGLAQRPQMVAAQGLAAVMLALASWQVFGWMTTFQPVVGDVVYAMELVVASPASLYLGGLQLDVQSLGLWSLVGIGGWLVSENGWLGRRLSATRLTLP
jgi:hypothetical protein